MRRTVGDALWRFWRLTLALGAGRVWLHSAHVTGVGDQGAAAGGCCPLEASMRLGVQVLATATHMLACASLAFTHMPQFHRAPLQGRASGKEHA